MLAGGCSGLVGGPAGTARSSQAGSTAGGLGTFGFSTRAAGVGNGASRGAIGAVKAMAGEESAVKEKGQVEGKVKDGEKQVKKEKEASVADLPEVKVVEDDIDLNALKDYILNMHAITMESPLYKEAFTKTKRFYYHSY